MIYVAVSPGQYMSILYQGRHAVHPLKKGIDMSVLRKYQLHQTHRNDKAYCAILNIDNAKEVGIWIGVFIALNWGFEVVSSRTWMDYFGLYPDDKDERDNHWMTVARLRYPMMNIKKDNYETILTACYLHDRHENEKNAVFA